MFFVLLTVVSLHYTLLFHAILLVIHKLIFYPCLSFLLYSALQW